MRAGFIVTAKKPFPLLRIAVEHITEHCALILNIIALPMFVYKWKMRILFLKNIFHVLYFAFYHLKVLPCSYCTSAIPSAVVCFKAGAAEIYK